MAGATLFAIGEVRTRPILFVPLLLLLAAAMGAWVGFMVRRQGVLPRLSKAPAEFVPALCSYWIGVVGLLAMIVTFFFGVGSEVAALVAAIGVFVGAVLYSRRYDKAAAALRARLE